MGQDVQRRYKVTKIYRGKGPSIQMGLTEEETIAETHLTLKHLLEEEEPDLVGFYCGIEEEAIIARLTPVRRMSP